METPSPRLYISEIISPSSVDIHLKSNQKEALLGELVSKIPELGQNQEARERLLRALIEREQLHSTGIGDGIALPHARNAIVGLVDRPVIIFGRHDTGIPFGAIDGAPARLFFLLVAPNVSMHLQMLARISRLLRVPKLRQNLLTVEKPEKAVQLLKEAESQLG